MGGFLRRRQGRERGCDREGSAAMTPEEEAELRRRFEEVRAAERAEFLAGVNKVVASVGSNFAPPGLDPMALKRDLDSALHDFQSDAIDKHRAGCREVENEFEAFEKHAKRLRNLTQEHERLSENIEWARRERERYAKYRVGLAAIMRPLSYMIGWHLAPIFEKHFGIKAGASRDRSGNTIGPFVRFALCVLNEYNPDQNKKPIAAASVESALRDAARHKAKVPPKKM
jgi:hypothetical protein